MFHVFAEKKNLRSKKSERLRSKKVRKLIKKIQEQFISLLKINDVVHRTLISKEYRFFYG